MEADVRELTVDNFVMQGISPKDEAVKTDEAERTVEAPKTREMLQIVVMETVARGAENEGSSLPDALPAPNYLPTAESSERFINKSFAPISVI
jgi:hypothetical protein